jgi:L-aminopeptidase/D-esterase-like protein
MEKAQSNVSGQAKWTFMVYMAGDNNLDGAALRNIAEMAQAGISPLRSTLTIGVVFTPA